MSTRRPVAVATRYGCAPDQAAEIASRASLIVASGRHLIGYVDGALDGDARTALDEALADLKSAARASYGASTVRAGIGIARADWQRRLAQRRADPVRDAAGIAVIDELLASSASASAVDALRRLIASVVRPSAALYDGAWPKLKVLIATRGAHPRREADPYGISAVTLQDAGRTEVRLQIHAQTFGPEALAALAGALVHECVCHVATQPVEKPDNASVFEEGFMDWAASYYLQAWAPALPGELGAIVVEHDASHRAILVEGTAPAALARKGGRHAAQRMAHCLAREHGASAQRASWLVARFAARLNEAPVPRSMKDAWTSELATRPEMRLSAVELDCIHGEDSPLVLF